MTLLLLLFVHLSPPCLQLRGVVQDNATRQPLSAQLSLYTPTGKVRVGSAAEGSGLFSIAVTCQATALLVERPGYRPQTLPLNLGNPAAAGQAVADGQTAGLRIPLVAVDKQATDRPYQQSEQRHYTQAKTTAEGETNAVQHNTFDVVDALTNRPLRATVCFFFTEKQPKKCVDVDGTGRFKLDFTRKDIVAMEVQSAGYQVYKGNLLVEHLDGRELRHNIGLLRELTLLSIQTKAAASQIDLRATDDPKRIPVEAVPGAPGIYCTGNLRPARYELALLDARGQPGQHQLIELRTGLNVSQLIADVPRPIRVQTVDPAAVDIPELHLPDQIPPIYFEQGTYTLRPDSRAVLMQVATYLKTHPGISLKAIGHTDPQGDEQLNRYLSEFRAKVAVNFLFWQGISEDRLTYAGHGSRFVVSPGTTDESRSKNRRVFLKLDVPKAPNTP